MLKSFGMAVLVVTLCFAFGASGFAQSDVDDDGSAPYLAAESGGKIGEPSPQIVWRGCCSPTWEVPGTRRTVYEGPVCLYSWKCFILWGDPRATYIAIVEEAQVCCYEGLKVFGVCVSKDSTPTCWWKSTRRLYFVGCGCTQ